MADVASLEAEVKEFKLQLETVQTSLQADPSNQELLSLQSELEEFISLTEQSIAELRPSSHTQQKSSSQREQQQQQQQQYPASTSPAASHQQQHHHHQRQVSVSSETTPGTETVSFNVNDTVLARWASGDGSFYPAKITSITGSKANPKYIVTFKKYNNVETLSAKDVKPITTSAASTTITATTTDAHLLTTTSSSSPMDSSTSSTTSTHASLTSSHKRKADPLSNTAASPPTSTHQHLPSATAAPAPSGPSAGTASTIISAAADINPALASAARNGQDVSKASDGHGRGSKPAKRARANKELEQGKAKWQEFANKNKFAKRGVSGKKDSMFRTGEGVGARVGFTGSGQQMRKDPARTKHIYERREDDY